MIEAVATGLPAGALTGASDRATVTRDEFMRLLVAELTSQDPLDPLDNGEFMQQLVGLQMLEQTAALTDSLRTFQQFMEMSSGSALIGRTAVAQTADGQLVSGEVTSVVLEGGRVNVVIGSQSVPLGSILEIAGGQQ